MFKVQSSATRPLVAEGWEFSDDELRQCGKNTRAINDADRLPAFPRESLS